MRNTSVLSSLPYARISVTRGLPSVIVEVLSSAKYLTELSFCSVSAFLTRTPYAAARPVPAMTATGVASPNAHGQLITSTDIAMVSDVETFPLTHIHTINVMTASAHTTGTNTAETLSAIF